MMISLPSFSQTSESKIGGLLLPCGYCAVLECVDSINVHAAVEVDELCVVVRYVVYRIILR